MLTDPLPSGAEFALLAVTVMVACPTGNVTVSSVVSPPERGTSLFAPVTE